ncbi:unnamed protein product [Paramecium pentaurelia]|uniref:PH domain-containing protein n=1 Tax=Paramecium pentaurelia TaxID=43138 RepID=A0A8S1SNW9_9CILI|nr:unnamed protein product [Paramecium pentaurelia]
MFEYLLEKILNQVLGKFIDGFDTQNLHIGIWSGEVTIQDVALKPDIIKMLELPIKLCFSHVGKLKLNVPWKSLTSSPVEVVLSDLYLIISLDHPDHWQFMDYSGFIKKMEILEKFKEQIISSISEKSKQQNDKDNGYFMKLVFKIIDNIQLSITNIHIRFEDTIRNEFAWGISLKSIETYTCNQEWKKQFFDRTKEENKKVPLQKILRLMNIGAYWNQQEKDLLYSKEKDEILKKMAELVISQEDPKDHPRFSQFMLLLNASGRFYQNTSGKFDSPEFSFSLELNTIDLAIENSQLQQVIRMAELFSLYQSRLNKQKKQKLLLTQQQIEDQKLIFQNLYEKILRSSDQTNKALTKNENDLFEQSVSNLSIDILCESAREIIKVVEKERAIKEAEDKKKKKGSWFSWGSKKDNQFIDEKEKDELSKFIDQLADFPDVKDLKRPVDYVWIAVTFSLKSGSIHVLKQFEAKREGVQLKYSGFEGQLYIKESGMIVQLGLSFIGIDLVTEPIINNVVMYSQQTRKVFVEQVNKQKFIDFTFETNPIHHKGVDKYLKLETGSLKLVFNPIILVRIQQFIDFQIKDETLKNAAWDSVEYAQDLAVNQMAKTQLSPSILFVDVTVKSTIVLVPIPNTNENWLLNLGDISIVTPNMNEIHYDNFEIKLQDFTFKHYKSIQDCQNSIINGSYLNNIDDSFSVIQNIKVKIIAKLLRGSSKPPKELPQFQVSGVLQQLNVFVNPLIYNRIIKVADCFIAPITEPEEAMLRQSRLTIEKAQTERTVLIEKATKVGKIWKRGQQLKWTQYTGVLSGGYIYLFAKPKDEQAESYFWVRNSDFEDIPQQEAGMNNAFYIKNKYGDTLVGFDKQKMANDWKEAIEEMRTILKAEKHHEHTNTQNSNTNLNKESRPLNLKFELSGFYLHLQDEKQSDWLEVVISGLSAGTSILNGSIDLDLKLRDLYVKDSVQNYLNPLFKYIVKSDPDPESNELININVQQINTKDKRYNKKNLIVQVTFGTLCVIAKPLVIAKLILFVTPEDQQNQIKGYEQMEQAKKKIEQTKKELEGTTQTVKFDNMQDIILMDVNVKIRSINAILVHRFTILPLAEIKIENTEIGLIKYVDELQLNGTLGNLQLFDLTNYPNTLSQESEYDQIQPKQMIGVKHQQQSLLKVSLILFSDGSSKIFNNVNIIIDVEMSQLIINVMMQPVLRLLDYTLQQLLYALQNPKQTISPNSNLIQVDEEAIEQYQNLKSQYAKQTIKLSEDESSVLQKLLNNPPGMKLNVKINNPQVILQPNQNSNSFMIIDLGTIFVSNKRIQVTNRINGQGLESVWVEQFLLNMKDIQIYQQNEQIKREFSLPFDFNIQVEIFTLAEKYSLNYPKLKFDEQLKINCFVAPMILQMTHSDYMFLMKCLFHNIAYDDGFDNMIRINNPEYFKAFFTQQNLQQIKLKEMLLQQNEQPQINFQLDIENFTIFLLKDIQPKPTPFLKMMLILMRITFQKCNNGSMKVNLFIRDMEGSMFQGDQILQEFYELPFIGNMNFQQKYTYEQVTNLNGLVRGRQGTQSNADQQQLNQRMKRDQIFKFEDALEQQNDNNVQHKLIFSLLMNLNGDKIINVELSDFKLQLHAGPLFDALQLIAMDDPDLNPKQGKFINSQYQQQQQQQQQNGVLTIKVNLKNVITCVPSQVESNVLAIRGIFDITLKMYPQKTLKQVQTEIMEKNIPEKDWNKLNIIMSIDAKLKRIEVFLCKNYDLGKKDDFKQVKKREILQPADIEIMIARAAVFYANSTEFGNDFDINCRITPINLKISFKDLLTMQTGLTYQLSQMPKQNSVENNEQQKSNELSKLDASHLNKLQMNSMRIDLEIEKTKVVVLNDMGNTFAPLFDLQVDLIKILLQKKPILFEINLLIPFELHNFNPLTSKWEPIIEKIEFQIIYLQSLLGETNNLITIEQLKENESFNITLSTVCVQTILKVLKIMNKIFKKSDTIEHKNMSKSSLISEIEGEEVLIQESPYAIRNLTGRPLQIDYIDKPNSQSLNVPVNQQLNLVYDEEMESMNSNRIRRVNVNIKLDKKTFPLKYIDLDKTRGKLYEQEGLQAYGIVKLDQVTSQKILIVSSPIIIVNKTSKTIILQISDERNQQIFKLQPLINNLDLTNVAPIPIGFENSKFCLKVDNCPQFSEEFKVDSLIRTSAIGQPQVVRTRDGINIQFKIYIDKDYKDKVKIELQAPYKITNSLPTQIYVQILNQRKETTYIKKIQPRETIEDYMHCLSSIDNKKNTYMRVLVQGFYWSSEYQLSQPLQEDGQKVKVDAIGKLQLVDGMDNQLTLLVFEPWRQSDYNKATREFVIYSTGYILNKTGMELQYYVSEKKKHLELIAGQNPINSGDQIDKNIIYIRQDCGNQLQLSHSSAPQKFSQFPIQISAIGEPYIDVIKADEVDSNRLVQTYLGAKLDFKVCNSKYTLLSRVITLEPRFILVNNSDKELIIIDGNYNQIVQSKQRTIYQVKYNIKEKDLFDQQFITMNINENTYHPSGRINISAIGIVNFQLRHTQNSQDKLYFSCDTRKEGCILYVIFTELSLDQAPYKIELAAEALELEIQELKITLRQDNQVAYFAWDEPQQTNKILNVELRVADDPYNDFTPFKYKLNPDIIGVFKIYTFKPKKGSRADPISVALTIMPQGNQKHVKVAIATQEQKTLYQSKPKQDFLKQVKEKENLGIEMNEDSMRQSYSLQQSHQSQQQDADKILIRINLKINAFSLSFVHNSEIKKRPAEYFHFLCKNIEFVTISTNISLVVQMRVQYINFDHNAQFFVQFPVILTPQKYSLYQPILIQQQSQQQQAVKQYQQSEKYFFNFLIMKDNRVTSINLFQNITLEIDPFEVKIEQLLINNFLEFVWAITSYQGLINEYDKNQSGSVLKQKQSDTQSLQEKQNSQAQIESIYQINEEWKTKTLPKAQLPTYISEIIISPIAINVTFQMTGKGDLKIAQSFLFASIAQALGVALTDISDAPIFISGWKLDNCFDTIPGMLEKMRQFYQSEGMKQVGKIIGSLSIIGNPIGLFNNVSTGFKDFIDKPAAGLTQGPLEAGLGLAQGAGSLVSHTILGAINSVNKIAGSVGGGLANLTMDEDYLRKREKMKMQKPKHIGQGLGQGAQSIMTGITDGIAGIFLKPIQETKEKGLKGVFTGTAKGFAGLIIKPITGVLDGLSQTAAGIQNTVQYFDDKPNNNRSRNIRPVYGYEGYITEFVVLDAEAYATLQFIRRGQLINNRFVASYFLNSEQDGYCMLVLTIEHFIYMSVKTKKKVWILASNEIIHLEIVSSGIKIQVNKPQKQLKNKYITQLVIGDDLKYEIFKTMQTIWDSIKANTN